MRKSQRADQDNHKRFDGGGANDRGNGGDGRQGSADGRRQMMRYAGLAGQLAVSAGVAVWLGIKADKWLKLSFPIFSLVVPLLVIVYELVQIVKANSGNKNEK